MRTRTLPFLLVGLTLLLPGRGRGQPPDEPTTPEEVVRAFLARAEAQEWNQLAELWTSESQALLESINAEVPFLIQAFLLLQATPGRPVQTGEPQVADGTAVVPLKKELALEFQVALRPEGRQWKIHLPATHLQPLGPAEQLEAETVLLFDSTQGQANAHDQGESLPEPGRHQGGDNLGFADGHVQWAWAEEARRLLGLEGEPEAALPDPNGFEDYVAAGKLAVEREEALPEEADEAVLEAALKENTAALSRLREGFQKECRCPPVRSFNAPLPYLADFRKLARILRIEGRLAERQGNAAAAIDSYLDMLRLAQDTARGGVLIHRLVAVAIETMAYEAFSGLLEKF